MTLGPRLTDDGITWRRWGRERRMRWDEVALEGDAAVGSSGERVPLSPEDLRRAEAAITPPAPLDGTALSTWIAGPFAASRAAAALLAAAESAGATDVHLEPTPGGVEIRLRIGGSLRPWASGGPAAAARLTAALKGIAGCLPYRRDVVQEGRISRDAPRADVRASFVPTAFGERVALRLFGRMRTLDQLGVEAPVLAAVRDALAAPRGLLLVSGACGAGKTTTIYAALAHLAAARPGAHLSLEDPIEQRLRAMGIPVDQVELDPARGVTGEGMLAAALRQDVDVLAVGEIRTPAEARLALHAAHTGRLVLAGIHAGSPAEACLRMRDLGAEPAILEASLVCVLHQELMDAACEGASHLGTACPECRGTGRRRRASIRLDARRKERAA